MKKQGFHEIKGVTVKYGASTKGILAYFFTITVGDTDIRVRIAQDADRDAKTRKVNSLIKKKANLVLYGSPWTAGEMSGVTQYLQSIEEAT